MPVDHERDTPRISRPTPPHPQAWQKHFQATGSSLATATAALTSAPAGSSSSSSPQQQQLLPDVARVLLLHVLGAGEGKLRARQFPKVPGARSYGTRLGGARLTVSRWGLRRVDRRRFACVCVCVCVCVC